MDDVRSHPFVRTPTVQDIGMGALYFFASHMVIRTMFYIGVDKGARDVVGFLLVVLVAVVMTKLFPGTFTRLRLQASEYMRVPAVSAVAMLGAFLELLSILPQAGPVPFFTGAALVGVSFGWLVSIWTASFRLDRPDPRTFSISPALLWAVAFYFCFRCASTISPTLSEGYLLALPLITIGCFSVTPRDGTAEHDGESRRSSLILVWVSAVFALLGAIMVHVADKEGLAISSSLNAMVLFEVVMTAVCVACCRLMHWLACQPHQPRRARSFYACLLCVPTLLVGVAMGAAYDPESLSSLMWELSFWVMLIAVFAYDLRASLYVGDGLAVGLMFESMCIAQIATQLLLHIDGNAFIAIASIALAALYLVGVLHQLLASSCGKASPLRPKSDLTISAHGEIGADRTVGAMSAATVAIGDSATRDVAPVGPASPEDALEARCIELSRDYGLTEAEMRILDQVARGRSARYIAEDLGVSFNTVRTHIRHIYEKLSIHSKQELIDLVESGEG